MPAVSVSEFAQSHRGDNNKSRCVGLIEKLQIYW